MSPHVKSEKLVVSQFPGEALKLNVKSLKEYSEKEVGYLIYFTEFTSKAEEFDPEAYKGLPKSDFNCPYSRALRKLVELKNFKPKPGTTLDCTVDDGGRISFATLFGVSAKPTPVDYKSYGYSVGESITKNNVKLSVLVFAYKFFNSSEHLTTFLTGLLVGLGTDKRYKKDSKDDFKFEEVSVYTVEQFANVDEVVLNAKLFAEGSHVARQLTASPANFANSHNLSDYFLNLARSLGLHAKVLEREECEKLGMGSYLSVAQGSFYSPKFVHAELVTEPVDGKLVKVALLGKGITFDSGGYNIKNAACHIDLMKGDMAGFAAVCGALFTLGKLKPKGVHVHFLSPLCENMVSSLSYRPGDVVTASNGKTIEVINTDAEGRLTLADGLVYAEKLGVDYIVDIATLTGGIVIALGDKYAGYYTDDEAFSESFQSGLKLSGECAWRMPIVKDYAKDLKSNVADLSNVNKSKPSFGSSISATLFLSEFVEKTPWLHVDMAGGGIFGGNATGFGANSLASLVLVLANKK